MRKPPYILIGINISHKELTEEYKRSKIDYPIFKKIIITEKENVDEDTQENCLVVKTSAECMDNELADALEWCQGIDGITMVCIVSSNNSSLVFYGVSTLRTTHSTGKKIY